MSDTSDQPDAPNDDGADLDVEAEQERLDDLGRRIDDNRHQAEEELEPGHAGRMFADEGTERLVRQDQEDEGDMRAP